MMASPHSNCAHKTTSPECSGHKRSESGQPEKMDTSRFKITQIFKYLLLRTACYLLSFCASHLLRYFTVCVIEISPHYAMGIRKRSPFNNFMSHLYLYQYVNLDLACMYILNTKPRQFVQMERNINIYIMKHYTIENITIISITKSYQLNLKIPIIISLTVNKTHNHSYINVQYTYSNRPYDKCITNILHYSYIHSKLICYLTTYINTNTTTLYIHELQLCLSLLTYIYLYMMFIRVSSTDWSNTQNMYLNIQNDCE